MTDVNKSKTDYEVIKSGERKGGAEVNLFNMRTRLHIFCQHSLTHYKQYLNMLSASKALPRSLFSHDSSTGSGLQLEWERSQRAACSLH